MNATDRGPVPDDDLCPVLTTHGVLAKTLKLNMAIEKKNTIHTSFFKSVWIVLCLVYAEVNGQSSFYIKPTVGIQAIFCELPTQFRNQFTKERYDPSTDYWGLLLQYNPSPNFRISTGVTESDIGWHYLIQTPTYELKSGVNGPMIKVPLKLDYVLKKDIHLARLDSYGYRYAFIFDFYITGGITYNIFNFNNFENGRLSFGSGSFRGNSISIDEKLPTIIRRRGVGAKAGFGMQFKNNDKDRLDLQFVFYQGLQRMMLTDVNYTVNQNAYFLLMISRGTSFRITASYPIRLSRRQTNLEE